MITTNQPYSPSLTHYLPSLAAIVAYQSLLTTAKQRLIIINHHESSLTGMNNPPLSSHYPPLTITNRHVLLPFFAAPMPGSLWSQALQKSMLSISLEAAQALGWRGQDTPYKKRVGDKQQQTAASSFAMYYLPSLLFGWTTRDVTPPSISWLYQHAMVDCWNIQILHHFICLEIFTDWYSYLHYKQEIHSGDQLIPSALN